MNMDGFTLIPKKQKADPIANANNLQDSFSSQSFSNTPDIKLAMDQGVHIPEENISEEVIDRLAPQKSSLLDGGLFFLISMLVFLGSLAYSGYLLFIRQITAAQIEDYSFKLQSLASKIDKNEISDLQNMDTVLKSLRTRMDNHILPTQIFGFINQNMRNSLQLTEYKVEPSQDGFDVIFSCVAPSFKDMAEQTEKLVELKKGRIIKNFVLSNLSFESDTNRVRFTIKTTFDRQKISANGSLINKKQ